MARRGLSDKTDKPRDIKYVIKRLWGYLMQYKLWLFAALILTGAGNICALIGPSLSGRAIDAIHPGGGTDFGANPLESVYYIVEGQMTLKTEDQETTLFAGDCFHCSGGTPKSIINNGGGVTKMLVALLPPQA